MKAAAISEQGTRPDMEDAFYLDADFAGRAWIYGGVYDGHGGDRAAKHAASTLHSLFVEAHLSGLEPAEAFIFAYERVGQQLENQESGTTATDFFIRESDVFVANAGDSRAIVVGQTEVKQLTAEHRLTDRSERTRILEAGGGIRPPYVTRGTQGIMTTRSLGDRYFRPAGIIAVPSITRHAVSNEDLFLISASDGLWDNMTNEDVSAIARTYSEPRALLSALRDEVLHTWLGSDNLTVIAVSLH